MAEFLKPDNLNIVWASGGDRLYPGDTKYQRGWGVEIPPRQYFNEIDYKQDQMLAHLNQHGIAVWDATTEYQANKSYVQGSDGRLYKAALTNVNIDPVGDLTNTWVSPIPPKASQVEAVSLTDNSSFLTSLNLVQLFSKGSFSATSANGSQELPSGLVVKWGNITTGITGVMPVVFTQAFPSACLNVNTSIAAVQSLASISQRFVGASTPTKTGFTIYAADINAVGVNIGVNWVAIGY